MPVTVFALMLLFAIFAGGATVWLLTLAGPAALALALPVFLAAAYVLHRQRK